MTVAIAYPDVLDVIGTNDHQLCHWARDGLIPGMPRHLGSGNRRGWTYGQIRHTRALRLLSESNPNLSRFMVEVIARRLAVADWSEPFVFHFSDQLDIVIDLPTIETEVAKALARLDDPLAEVARSHDDRAVARTERRLRDAG